MSKQPLSKTFSTSCIVQDRKNSYKTSFSTPDNTQYSLALPQNIQSESYVKTSSTGTVDWESGASYATNVTDQITPLQSSFSTLNNLINTYAPSPVIYMESFSETSGTIIGNSTTALDQWVTWFTLDTRTFLTDVPSMGANSNMSSFTPLHSGMCFLTLFPGPNTNNIRRQFRFNGNRILFDPQTLFIGGHSFATYLEAGNTYNMEFASGDSSPAHYWNIAGCVYVYDKIP